MKTHIRLTRVTVGEDAATLLLPIAGTSFLLDADYQTIAITASGQRFIVEESIANISEVLDITEVDI